MAACERFRADIVHVHGIGRAIAPAALEQARQAGIGVVLTYHTPTATCVRGTLLLHGAQPCDGRLDARRCTACTLTGHGLPPVLAELVARTPVAAAHLLRATRARGRWATALRSRELITLRHEQTRKLLEAADLIVAPAAWVQALLHRLGVPAPKITLSRQGITYPPLKTRTERVNSSLRLVYIGRLEPAKGVHLVLRALRALPGAAVELHVYGVTQADAHASYRRKLREAAALDARVTLHDPVAPDEVVRTLAHYDVLVVASQQLETGPLVVLEAFAAGLPVVGSRLGGIAELVHDGQDGLLVDAGSATDWAAAFDRLLREPELLGRLQQGVRPPRTMAAVADDMAEVYRMVAA
jgi:glycosyltransferase involved in cell wall biosynthesis